MMLSRIRAFFSGCLLIAGFSGMAFSAIPPVSPGEVIVVPIEGTVDDGMAHLVQRAVAQANEEHAAAIVLDVNSPGGLVEAAFLIRDAVFSAKVPVIAYVSERAYSAAALITLSAGRIVMAPGATIGAAEPIPATDKIISALRGEFESTAIRNHRDPKIAGSMVDKTMTAPFKQPNMVLTLNTNDAVSAHIADAIAPTLDAALAMSHLENAPRVSAEYTWAEALARFATDPTVSGILLSIGMLGILIEMQTMHGISGAIGVLAFALFFGTHIYAGFSNGLVIALALLGILGILWELHVVPGHTLPGVLGAVALLFAVLLAFGIPSFFTAMETVAIAVLATIAVFLVFTRLVPQNAWMQRLALRSSQGPEYVASRSYADLLGQSGVAASFLRPAGVATIGGRRITVLTEGDFIPVGTPVRVTRVEGARIFVTTEKENSWESG